MTNRDKLIQQYYDHYSKIAEHVAEGTCPPIFFNSGFIDKQYDVEDTDKHCLIYTHLIEKYNIDVNDKTLIELGCGFGKGCYFLKSKYNIKEIVGCDINSDLLSVARQLYTKTKFIAEDIISLQSINRFFDIALTIETGTYWIGNSRTNSSFSSVVKPGGYLLIATDVKNSVNIADGLTDFVLLDESDITKQVLSSLNEDSIIQNVYKKRIQRLNTTYRYISQVYKKREQ